MKQFSQAGRLIKLLIIVAFSASYGTLGVAATLNLRATATVAETFSGVLWDGTVSRLPFVMNVGDTFAFSLSIESQTPNSDHISGSAKFRSTIGGVQFRHEELDVWVVNDSDVGVLSIARPSIIRDVGPLVGDSIAIVDYYGSHEFSGTTNNQDSPRFRLELGFVECMAKRFQQPLDYPAVLNEALIPQDPATWLAFADREIGIRFENSAYVGAYITSIAALPEPSTLLILGCGLFVPTLRVVRGQTLLPRQFMD